jgi:hypothetical protein
MRGDYIYTVYNNRFQGSDVLENALSKIEGQQAQVLNKLCTSGYVPVDQDRLELCGIVALQALRHPDVLSRGRRTALQAVEAFSDVNTMSEAEFVRRYGVGDVSPDEAKATYAFLAVYPKTALEAQKDEIFSMSVQSAELAETHTLVALPNVCGLLERFQVRLLDAPADREFVLGDTPVPQDNLAKGFTLPLSKSLALSMWHDPEQSPSISRCTASQQTVEESNKWQWEHCAHIVVGSRRALLETL